MHLSGSALMASEISVLSGDQRWIPTLSGSTLSRADLFEVRSVLSSCPGQLLESAIYSKRSARESVDPERCMLTLIEVPVTALVDRKVRRLISEAVKRL